MAGLKKLVGVTLAVVIATAVAVYVLRPTATPNSSQVVVSEPGPTNGPQTPASNPGPLEWSHSRATYTGNPGGTPTSLPPPAAHGKGAQNSNGPNHGVCVPLNDHIPSWASDEGANRYRGTCGAFPGVRTGNR